MNSLVRLARPRGLALALLACLSLLATPRALLAQMGDIPSLAYFKTFNLYNDGEYNDALANYQSEGRGGVKSVDSRWVDSICYHTMVGECFYQMGRYQDALNQYNSALDLYLAFPDWMIRVDFPQTLQ